MKKLGRLKTQQKKNVKSLNVQLKDYILRTLTKLSLIHEKFQNETEEIRKISLKNP